MATRERKLRTAAGCAEGPEVEKFDFMLFPMLVQYVVGLCVLRNNPDAVEVTLGDFVLDWLVAVSSG